MEEFARIHRITAVYLDLNFTTIKKNERSKLDFSLDTMDNRDVDSAWERALLFITNSYVFIIPQPQLYSPFEKLLFPFDLETWVWLAIFFAVGFLVIFITYRCSIDIRRYVFGRSVTTPSFNLTGTFFGIGQTVLPGRNFARFILMNFILFCLIMRMAYQGMMFEMLQKDMKKPDLATIEELIENNFTFLFYETKISPSIELFRR